MRDQPGVRLEQVVARYLQAIEHGEQPDRSSLLNQHPELADELRSFFHNHDALRRSQTETGLAPSQSTRHPDAVARQQRETGGRKAVASSAPLPEISGYSLIRQLGAGGMGHVFLATHLRMNRRVAIKLLPSDLVFDDALVKRFHREAQVAAQLTHPNIVTAYDAGEDGDVHYLVMEYVDGADLGAIVRHSGPLGLDDAIRCIVQAGRGIAYAHRNGVIHRDIKPGNLLVDRAGTVKVLDMGLARWSLAAHEGTASDLSLSGMIMGTIDYLAPEQAANSKSADHRSDLYSLGCTLYYLVHGKPIHPRDSFVEKLIAHREAVPPQLAEGTDAQSADLNRIFHKMIARDPDARFETVEHACKALMQWRGFSDDDLTLNVTIPQPSTSSPHHSTLDKEPAQNVDTTRMLGVNGSQAVGHRRWWIVATVLALLLLGSAAAALLLRMRTHDGTLVVRCHIEGATVEIDQQKRITVTDPAAQNEYVFELPSGTHRVRALLPDGTEITSKSITIASNKIRLFEVDLETAEVVAKTAKSGTADRADLEPNVHTVAVDGTAEHTSLASALRVCKANDTIRVVDDGEYVDSLVLGPSAKHQGLTIEFTGNASWKPPAQPFTRCLRCSQSDLTLRGINFIVEPLQPVGFGVLVHGRVSNIRIQDCTFDLTESNAVGVSVEQVDVPDGQPPIQIVDSQFLGVGLGVQVSGCTNDEKSPLPVRGLLICDNRFEHCVKAVLYRGQLSHVLFAGNTVCGTQMAGLQFQHLLPGSDNLLVANNSFLQTIGAIRIWDNGVPSVAVSVINNLTLGAVSPPDWMILDSGGNPSLPKGPGDGEALIEKWTTKHNFREGVRQDNPIWIPPGKLDHLVAEIKDISRDPEQPEYLRPPTDSPLSTGGIGGDLPAYVGAVPPRNTDRFDWLNYFTTVFRPGESR